MFYRRGGDPPALKFDAIQKGGRIPAPTGYCFFIILFFISFPLHAFSPQFQNRASLIVDKATKQHPGILILKDLSTSQEWKAGNLSLLNKKFLPGSLMKLITAKLALDQKVNPTFKCEGRVKWGARRYSCWNHKGHGELTLISALAKSCNLYFLNLLSILNFEDWEKTFGDYFSSSLPQVKSDASKFYNLSLGEEALLKFSPEELFLFWEKYLKDIQSADYSPILQALKLSSEQGTLKRLRYKIIGKSGTADSLVKSYKTDAWLLGAYPQENPKYIFLVFLRQAYGFREPVDLMNKIFPLLD